MPPGQGQLNTLSESVTLKRTITNLISNITPRDIPCIDYFGLNNQSRFGLQNYANNRYEWLEDQLRIRTTGTVGSPTGAMTTVTVTTGHGIYFRHGDVWEMANGDLFWVDTVNTGTNVVTGIVNWGARNGGTQGTWTSTIATLSAMNYKYSARVEGEDSTPSPYTEPTNPYNLSHILQAEIRVSGSEQISTRYGIPDTFQYQLEKWLGGSGAGNGKQGRAGDLMLDLENTFFAGVRVARTSGGAAGGMGGFPSFITTNKFHNSGTPRALTQTILEDALKATWASGGMPDVIIVNAKQKQLINSFYLNSSIVRIDRGERTGGGYINQIETDFGTYDLMLTRRADVNKVYIAQKDKVGWVTLRPFHVHELAVTGDYVRKEILGEYGFVVQNEACHAMITDLS